MIKLILYLFIIILANSSFSNKFPHILPFVPAKNHLTLKPPLVFLIVFFQTAKRLQAVNGVDFGGKFFIIFFTLIPSFTIFFLGRGEIWKFLFVLIQLFPDEIVVSSHLTYSFHMLFVVVEYISLAITCVKGFNIEIVKVIFFEIYDAIKAVIFFLTLLKANFLSCLG